MFFKCKTKEEVKVLFREIAFFLHPDHGGDDRLMALLQDAKENTLAMLSCVEDIGKHQEDQEQKRKEYPEGKYSSTFDDVDREEDRADIFDDIYYYADKHPSFDIKFVRSVEEFMNKKGFISSGQYNILVKIYYSFHIYKNNP